MHGNPVSLSTPTPTAMSCAGCCPAHRPGRAAAPALSALLPPQPRALLEAVLADALARLTEAIERECRMAKLGPGMPVMCVVTTRGNAVWAAAAKPTVLCFVLGTDSAKGTQKGSSHAITCALPLPYGSLLRTASQLQ